MIAIKLIYFFRKKCELSGGFETIATRNKQGSNQRSWMLGTNWDKK